MEQIKFVSVGFSTEDQNVFFDEGQHVTEIDENSLICVLSAFCELKEKYTFTDVNVALKVLTENDWYRNYEKDNEFVEAVDKFKKMVEGQKGFFFAWSVEYDTNIMFIFDKEVKEVVDIGQKLYDEEMKKYNDND